MIFRSLQSVVLVKCNIILSPKQSVPGLGLSALVLQTAFSLLQPHFIYLILSPPNFALNWGFLLLPFPEGFTSCLFSESKEIEVWEKIKKETTVSSNDRSDSVSAFPGSQVLPQEEMSPLCLDWRKRESSPRFFGFGFSFSPQLLLCNNSIVLTTFLSTDPGYHWCFQMQTASIPCYY